MKISEFSEWAAVIILCVIAGAANASEAFAHHLKLDETQAQAFVRAYAQYNDEDQALWMKECALSKRWSELYAAGPVSDANAAALIREELEIQESRQKLRENVVTALRKAIPENRIALFYQIDKLERAKRACK